MGLKTQHLSREKVLCCLFTWRHRSFQANWVGYSVRKWTYSDMYIFKNTFKMYSLAFSNVYLMKFDLIDPLFSLVSIPLHLNTLLPPNNFSPRFY